MRKRRETKISSFLEKMMQPQEEEEPVYTDS